MTRSQATPASSQMIWMEQRIAELEKQLAANNPLLEAAMSENGITHYCLGNGALKCDGCGQEKNWQTLDQMPDTLRKHLQAQAQRIDDTDCILSGRPWYVGA